MSYITDYENQRRNYEKRIRPLFIKALTQQVHPVIRWLEVNPGLPPIEALINTQIFVQPMIKSYQMIGNLSAKREYYYQRKQDGTKAITDFLSNLWETVINEYARSYAYRITNELSATTIETIQQALKEGYEAKLNNNQLAAYIRKKVQGTISKLRATLIARTESTTAANKGKEEGARSYFKEQGIKGYKEWIGRNDGRERPTHIRNNGSTIPIDEDFEVGTDLGLTPGALTLSAKERCNCRCTVIYMSERAFLRRESMKRFIFGFDIKADKYLTGNINLLSFNHAEQYAKHHGLYLVGEFVEEIEE